MGGEPAMDRPSLNSDTGMREKGRPEGCSVRNPDGCRVLALTKLLVVLRSSKSVVLNDIEVETRHVSDCIQN